MRVIETALPDVKIIVPSRFEDSRGFFSESYNARGFNKLIGSNVQFVQDNHSYSTKGTLRGLHYQIAPKQQAKLVRVVAGEVYDVVVDMRKSSPTFGLWVSVLLSGRNGYQLWVPEGFAHGFYVLSESADYLYKTTEYYSKEHERNISWNDPDLAISWPLSDAPNLSPKDGSAVQFKYAEYL
ncbi:dTDP-4-dehydrorhamnose 3,5-epimerase [Cellvibrio sp.]|uniref:dTDP-4-dehydrorhamnose 3,5-epimerase n=1 Tax=Cellvibrio sp. TaxID=1965322 RepID=UPI00396486AC